MLNELREQYIKNATLIARMEANHCTQCYIDNLKATNAELLRMIRAREEWEESIDWDSELTIEEIFELINS